MYLFFPSIPSSGHGSSCSSIEIESKPHVHGVHVAAAPETSIDIVNPPAPAPGSCKKSLFLIVVFSLSCVLVIVLFEASEARVHYHSQDVFQGHLRARRQQSIIQNTFFNIPFSFQPHIASSERNFVVLI
jgi:hypothetical protein